MSMNSQSTDNRLDKIEKQLDNIARSLIAGFDSMNKQFNTKANSDDVQQVLDLINKKAKELNKTRNHFFSN
jgi:non-homologous end joining protein Ku